MVFMIIRNKVKNMVNDVRYYFIDICLCLYLENEEKKTLPVIWTKTLTKIVSIVCDHVQNNLRVFNVFRTEITKDCNMWTIKHHSCMKFFFCFWWVIQSMWRKSVNHEMEEKNYRNEHMKITQPWKLLLMYNTMWTILYLI